MTIFKNGLSFGLIGIVCFSLTLPATRLAVQDIDPFIVGLGRVPVAAVMAALVLILTRQKVPDRRHWMPLVFVALGVAIGFPLFSTLAMTRVDASHGAIVLGLLPLSTALVAVLYGKERPSPAFWILALLGMIIVVGYALIEAQGAIQIYDLFLIGAVISAGFGYAVGAQLAKALGGWQVICWALVISAPFLVPSLYSAIDTHGFHPSTQSLVSFLYLSAVSMFLAFFAWYKGLALGGTAKVAQVQLLQPFLTLFASAMILGEHLAPVTVIAAASVVAVVFLAQLTRIRSSSAAVVVPVRADSV